MTKRYNFWLGMALGSTTTLLSAEASMVVPWIIAVTSVLVASRLSERAATD